MFIIREKDYDKQVRAEILLILGGSDEYTMDDTERAAETEIIGYLSGRFDVSKIFIDVPEWDDEQPYVVGDSVFFKDDNLRVRVFVANTDNLNEQPWNNILDEPNANWDVSDLRHPVIKMYYVDIVLYHLHSNLSKRQIPDERGRRYDRAIKWLTDIRDGKLQDPTLPILLDENGDEVDFDIRTGCGGSLNNEY